MSVSDRWSTWIAEQEKAAVMGNIERMQELTSAADSLLLEIQQLHGTRQRILDSAKELSLPASDLYNLAQSLPSWSNAAWRDRVRTAKRQMDHLRRLHLAIWVLISQCERFASESMQILTFGQVEASVYASSGNADTSGGHLLDAQI